MQFALGSVLKLMGSAFGGLGSFRVPSIRRALPVLLGGLLCAFGSSAMAQANQISTISLVNPPAKYAIGDIVTAQVVYDGSHTAGIGSPTMRMNFVSEGTTVSKTASCSRTSTNPLTIDCSYTVLEGDEASTSITIPANSLEGSALPSLEHAATSFTANLVDGVRLKVASIVIQSPPTEPYNKGNVITVQVTFSEPVKAFGAFGFALDLAGTDKAMTRAAASLPGTTFTYSYTVVTGDNAPGVVLLATNSADITDEAGNTGLDATTTIPKIPSASNVAIDTAGARIVNIRVTGNSGPTTYTDDSSGNYQIKFAVEFDEPVGPTGDGTLNPTLDVVVGTQTRSAALQNASALAGTKARTLHFWLTVQSEWSDTDGVATTAKPINFLANRTLVDSSGNVIVNSFPAKRFSDHRVDSVDPQVTDFSWTIPSGVAGNNVQARVTFSEEVLLGETEPDLALSIGGSEKDLLYIGGAGSKILTFRYTLVTADLSNPTDGKVTVTLAQTGAFDGNIIDAHGNPFAGTYDSESITSITVSSDAVDKTSPKANSVSIRGTSDKFKATDEIKFDVLFSEKVTVTGDPVLDFKIGNVSKSATYSSSDSTDAVKRFTYSVQTTDVSGRLSGGRTIMLDADDTILDDNSRGFNGGNKPSENVPAGVTYGAKVSISGGSVSGAVDTVAPKVKQLTILKSPEPGAVGEDGKKIYGLNNKISVDVTLDEDVVVKGDPTLALTLAVGDGTMTYVGLQGKRVLQFDYTVASADRDLDGVSIAANILSVSGNDSIEDAAGNTAVLAHDAVATSGDHKVDGSRTGGVQKGGRAPDPSAPTPSAISGATATASGPTTNGFLTSGTVTFTISFKEPGVDITAAPTLQLSVGGTQRSAICSGTGTGVRSITCRYTVQSGDEGTITGSSLVGGTIKLGQQDVVRSVSVTGPKVDAKSPELETLEFMTSAGSDGTFVVGNNIDVRARFSEAVVRTSQTTDPTLSLMVGGVAKPMSLQSPSTTAPATADWRFRYTVVAGDNDTDGVSIAANSFKGQLQDAAGNSATVTHAAIAADSSRKVDTKGPEFVNVSLAGEGKVYREGDTITATVTYDEAVDVTTSGSNAVRLQLIVGATQKTATYKSGDRSNTLTFEYVVKAGDSGPLRVPREGITGTVEDAAGNAATNIAALVEFLGYSVDARAPMLVGAPSITSSPASGSTYVEGETIRLQVRFDEAVVVTGEPRLPMMVGERLRNRVLYSGGSGTDALTFSYTVLAGDMDDDGVSVAANSLRLTDGATIKDVSGLSVASEKGTVSHAALSDQPGHKVDAVAPGIESVAISSSPASGDAYLIGEVIELTVTFSEDVAVSGSPMLGIMVGTGNRDAMCAQGGDIAAIACSYTVVANDFDADGVSVEANSLSGGNITDVPGNAASLTHDALADDPAHKVYAARPEVVGRIQPLSMAAGGASNSIDLADAGVFTGFQLTYSAVSDNTAVATAQVSGTVLSVTSGMEGTATVTVTATNLAGEASTTFGVIVATDPLEKAVLNDALAAIGRSMLSSTANVIGSRFELAATGAQSSLGGVRFGGSLSPEMQRLMAGGDPFAMQDRLEERALFGGSGSAGFGGAGFGGGYGLTADRLLSGTSFNMPLNALGTGGGTSFAIWGAGDLASFEGEPDDGMYDGSASAGFIGVDARGDGWLAGVSVSRSGAEADYTFDGIVQGGGTGGTLETAVTAFHPYARLEVGPDSEVWVIGGFGGGEADLSRTHVAGAQSSDLSMSMVIGGLRRALALEFGGADLSLRGDAGVVNLETDSGAMAIDGLSASASRLRLGLEAAWEGESATPFVEVSGRFDGGDGQTGGGIELAGGIRVLSPETGFGLEAKGRVLAMHTGEGYSESGIGVTASFEPGGGQGITFRLSPRWGGSADSTDLFWDEVGSMRDASQYAYGYDRAQTWGVDAALGYGFGLRSVPGLVTPFGQVDVSGDQDQRIRVGVRYGLMQGLMGGTQVEVSAERVDGEMYRTGETRMLVTGRARF